MCVIALIETVATLCGLYSPVQIVSVLRCMRNIRCHIVVGILYCIVTIHVCYCVSHCSGIQVFLNIDFTVWLMDISWNVYVYVIETKLFHVLRECHRWVHAALTLMNSGSEFRWCVILSVLSGWRSRVRHASFQLLFLESHSGRTSDRASPMFRDRLDL